MSSGPTPLPFSRKDANGWAPSFSSAPILLPTFSLLTKLLSLAHSAGRGMLDKTLSHYRVLEQIGAGGMGVVYRARDEQLERDVAIKLLPSRVLADEDARKRFRKEALSLARLNHPNIATVHEFGTQDDIDFLVVEYIPGTTLDAKLARGSL